MVHIDASTPQLEVVQKWFDAYISLDINRINALLSKNYKHQTSPKSVGLPEETKEEYIKRLGGMLPVFIKFDVRIQHQATALKFTD